VDGTAGKVFDRASQRERKRRAIIAAVGRSVARYGYDSTSLDDVAKELGISKPALYYYVKNKQEALFECHRQAFALGDRAREAALREGRDGRGRLLAFVRHYIALLTDELGGGALMEEHRHLAPEQQAELQPLRDATDRFLRGLMEEGRRDGSIGEVDPKMAIFAIMGAVRGIHRWFAPEGELTGGQIAQAFVDFFERGLAPRRAEPCRGA